MYITCQECDTIYRLDEKLLKPGGSKVRCSQCGQVFVARPPEPAPAFDPLPSQSDSTGKVAQTEEKFAEDELTGIDMAELDSILEQEAAQTDSSGLESESADLEWNELDVESASSDETGHNLDADFLLQEEDVPAEKASTPEVDEIDLEMDFELHDEESVDVPRAESGPAESSNEKLMDEFEDDLDLVFDDDTLVAEAEKIAEGEDTGGDELAFDELDLDLEEPQTAEAAPADTTDDDLIRVDDLALDDLALEPEEPPKSESAPADSTGDDLDSLDDLALDDLGFDFEEPQTAETAPTDSTDDDLIEVDEMALDDLGLDFEEPQTAETVLAENPDDDQNSSELKDDLDLELNFDLDDLDQIEQPSGEEQELSLDDGFEAGLSETDQQNSLEEESLEDFLDTASAEDRLQNEISADQMAEDIDLSDLEVLSDQDSEELEDLAIESKELENAIGDSSGEELEDLEFTLDAEYEDKSAAFEPADESNEREEEDLDLSDIEQMLEADGSDSAKLEDLTATTGLDDGARWMDTPENNLEIGAADELDLSEIEEAIEGVKKTPGKDSSDDELDLDFSIESEPSADSGDEFKLELDDTDTTSRELNLSFDDEKAPLEDNQELELELELEDDSQERSDVGEFELSELDDLVVKKPATVKPDTIDKGDIELEFQIKEEEEDDVVPSKTRTAGIAPTTTFSGETVEAALVLEKPPEVKPAKPIKQKKGTSKGLVFLFILILLGAGGYFGWDYMQKNGIEVPYVNKYIDYIDEYLHPKPKDPMGILSLSTQEINSKFIENENGGRLFVITGKVLNQYPTARGMIRLQGNLYTKGKILAKTEKIFVGFQVSDQELANLPVAEIKARLSTPPKPQEKVTQVAAGQTLPFMVVFSDLPENLDEFAIEMVSSTPIE